MAFKLNLGICDEPTVTCSYNYDLPQIRVQYTITNARRAYWFASFPSGNNNITLTDGAATGFFNVDMGPSGKNKSYTIVAFGCACQTKFVLGPCCFGKDYLRLSFAGVQDLDYLITETLPPPSFGQRTTYREYGTVFSNLSALNGTWLIPVTPSEFGLAFECNAPGIDTGVDVTVTLRFYSTGATWPGPTSPFVQDLTGTITGRLWLFRISAGLETPGGTMIGSSTGIGAINTPWRLQQNAVSPGFSPGSGVVQSYATTGITSASRGEIMFWPTPICGKPNPSGYGYSGYPVQMAKWVVGSHWLRSAQTTWIPVFDTLGNTAPINGYVEQEYISVP